MCWKAGSDASGPALIPMLGEPGRRTRLRWPVLVLAAVVAIVALVLGA